MTPEDQNKCREIKLVGWGGVGGGAKKELIDLQEGSAEFSRAECSSGCLFCVHAHMQIKVKANELNEIAVCARAAAVLEHRVLCMCSREPVWVQDESKQKLTLSEASSVFITINKSLRPTLSERFFPSNPHWLYLSC